MGHVHQGGRDRATDNFVWPHPPRCPVVPRRPFVGNRKRRKHEVPDHKVTHEGAARAEGQERAATQGGHLFHRNDRRRSTNRGSSDGDRVRSRSPHTQPPIPSLSLSIEGVVEPPEVRGREHDDSDPWKTSLCATQSQRSPQVTEKVLGTNNEVGLRHRTTVYSRRAPSPSRSIRSKRRRGASSSEMTP